MLTGRAPVIDIRVTCTGWPMLEILHKLAKKNILVTISTAKLQLPKQSELSLMFSDDKMVAGLNEKFRKVPAPTNVLSFPGCNITFGETPGEVLGDIVFALQTIKKETHPEKKTFENHLSHLMIHGFLHLFGYDHTTEDQAVIMENLEKEILASLGIANPYENHEIRPVKNKTWLSKTEDSVHTG